MFQNCSYRLCRLCLCGGGHLINVFEEEHNLQFRLENDIEELLNIKVVKDTTFPWLICATCLEALTEFRLFKCRCAECQIVFYNRVQNVYFPEAGDFQTNAQIKEEENDESSSDGSNNEGKEAADTEEDSGDISESLTEPQGHVSPVEVSVDLELTPIVETPFPEGSEVNSAVDERTEMQAPVEEVDIQPPLEEMLAINEECSEDGPRDGRLGEGTSSMEGRKSYGIQEIHSRLRSWTRSKELCLEDQENTSAASISPTKTREELILNLGDQSNEFGGRPGRKMHKLHLSTEMKCGLMSLTFSKQGKVILNLNEDTMEYSAVEIQNEKIKSHMRLFDDNVEKQNSLGCLDMGGKKKTHSLCVSNPINIERNTGRLSGSNMKSNVFQCDLCGSEFYSKPDIGKHMEEHFKDNCIISRIYHNQFSNVSEYERHSHHQGISPAEEDRSSECNVSQGDKKKNEYCATDASLNCDKLSPLTSSNNMGVNALTCEKRKNCFSDNGKLCNTTGRGEETVMHSETRKDVSINNHNGRGEWRNTSRGKQNKLSKLVCGERYSSNTCGMGKEQFDKKLKGKELKESGKRCDNVHVKEQSVILEEEMYSCHYCLKSFNKQYSLKNHLKTHTVEKPYSCSVCNKAFRRKDSLKIHHRTHTGEKPFSCAVCFKRFSDNRCLNDHMRTHSEDKPYVCAVCSKAFRFSSGLRSHRRIHIEGKPYSCTVCPMSFRDGGTLNRHIKTHTGDRPYRCFDCSKSFIRKTSLRFHIRNHTGYKPHMCSVCFKTFSVPGTLKLHMRKHTEDKQYKCAVCSKEFHYKNHLEHHTRIHTGAKPYSCSVCSKSFRQTSTLQRHKMTHTGEKPYQCSMCSKGYTKKNDLKNHVKKTHIVF